MENDICDCRNDTQVSSVRAASTSTRLSPESRLIVFSAIVLPVALAPLIVLRRSLVALHRKVDASYAASQALQRELKATLLDMSVRRDEHRQLKTLVGGLRRRIDELSKEAHKIELARLEREKETLEQISTSQARSRACLRRMRDIGASLADVAAFMHEVEIQQGLSHRQSDGRGIERLRYLALQLQDGPGIPKYDEAASTSSSTTKIPVDAASPHSSV